MTASRKPSFFQPFSVKTYVNAAARSFVESAVPKNLNTNSKYFLFGGVVNGISNGVFNAVMQLYLASFGYGSQSLGQIFMMNALATTILTIPSGILADRYGKKNMIATGFISVFISMYLFFTANSVQTFAVSFLLIGVCNACCSVLTPLYSSFFKEDDMDQAFGLWGLLNIVSMSAGSLVGYVPDYLVSSFSLNLNDSYRIVMMCAASLFVLQFMFYLKSSLGVKETLSKGFKFNLKSKGVVLKICTISLLLNIAGGLLFSLFPYYINRKFGIASAGLGLLFFAANLLMAFSKGLAAAISKRLGSIKSIMMGTAISALFFLMMPLSPSFSILSIFYVLRQGSRFMSDPLITSMFMKALSEDEKSTANSIRMMAMNGGGVLSPIIGGTLMEMNLDAPAYIGALLTLGIALTLPVLLRDIMKKEEPQKVLVAPT
jgi:MFS family permease